MRINEKDIFQSDKKKAARRTTEKTVAEHSASEPKAREVGLHASITDKARQTILDSTMSWTLYAMVFLMPLFVLPFLSEPIEYAKQILLFAGTFVLAMCYALKIASDGAIKFRFGAYMFGMLALLLAWLAASLFSLFPYASFVGIGGGQAISFSSLAAFIISAFIISQSFSHAHIARAMYTFFASSAVVAVLGVLQILGLFILPWDFTKSALFSPSGNFDTAGVIIALALVSAVLSAVRSSYAKKPKALRSAFFSIFTIAMLALLVILNDWRLWLIVISGILFSLVYLYGKLPSERNVGWVLAPGFVLVFSVTMLVAHPQTLRLPAFIQPSLSAGAKIAYETVKASPLVGFGPGTFISSFTKFRPAESNKDNYLGLWAVRFDNGGSFVITAIAAVGIAGALGMLVFALLFLYPLASRLFREPMTDENLLLLTTGAGVIALGTAALLKPSTMALSFLFWLFVGMSAVQLSRKTYTVAGRQNQFLVFCSLALYALLSAGITGALFVWKQAGADTAFAKALALDRNFSTELIEKQTRPEKQRVDEFLSILSQASAGEQKNPVYARTLSKALAYRLNELVGSQEQPNSDTTAQIQNITALMIQAAKAAYDANPHDIRNIENMSETYQQIAPYAVGADEQAVEYLKKASEQDPTNPAHELAEGRFLLSMSVIHSERAKNMKAEQQEEKAREEEAAGATLVNAEQALQRAIVLKDDYPAALYAMSMARTMQNKKEEALEFLDKTMLANANLYALQSADTSLFLSLGSSYQGFGEKEKAETAYKNALLMNPQFAVAKWQLALLYAEQGKNTDALALLEELRKNEPGNEAIAKKIQEIQETGNGVNPQLMQ